jgi:crossover junction endodeoxyribonuclease RuvC
VFVTGGTVSGVRVLGVDPGLTRCGLGVVEGAPGRPPSLVAAGVLTTSPGEDAAARLLAIEAGMHRWLTDHQPDAVAVERVFSQRNVRTVMGTAQAGTVAILCAARLGLPVALHTPSEVKAAVTGSGRAGKAQVTAMVMRLLGLAGPPRPADTADALALAICHLWRGGTQRRLSEAAAGTPAPSWPAPSPPAPSPPGPSAGGSHPPAAPRPCPPAAAPGDGGARPGSARSLTGGCQ